MPWLSLVELKKGIAFVYETNWGNSKHYNTNRNDVIKQINFWKRKSKGNTNGYSYNYKTDIENYCNIQKGICKNPQGIFIGDFFIYDKKKGLVFNRDEFLKIEKEPYPVLFSPYFNNK